MDISKVETRSTVPPLLEAAASIRAPERIPFLREVEELLKLQSERLMAQAAADAKNSMVQAEADRARAGAAETDARAATRVEEARVVRFDRIERGVVLAVNVVFAGLLALCALLGFEALARVVIGAGAVNGLFAAGHHLRRVTHEARRVSEG